MSVYITIPMDTLPSIAEAFGKSGEWATLWELNVVVLPDPNIVPPGTQLDIPNEWVAESAVEPTHTTSSARRTGSSISKDE